MSTHNMLSWKNKKDYRYQHFADEKSTLSVAVSEFRLGK